MSRDVYANDGELTLRAYYEKHAEMIAKVRKWQKIEMSDGTISIPTIDAYRKKMDKLFAEYPALNEKSIAEVTFFDIVDALHAVKVSRGPGRLYSDGTIGIYVSMLNDLYRYAEDRVEAENVILHFLPGRQTLVSRDHPSYIAPDKMSAMRIGAQVEKNRTRRRSLTINEAKKLYSLLINNITRDGRFVIIAIILYTGIRPSESRAIYWSDIIPIQSHDGAYLMIVNKTVSKDGRKLLESMKTSNAYRKIPIHPELMNLLELRKQYVEEQSGGVVDGPIGCYRNEFGRKCSAAQLGVFAKEQLKRIIPTEVMQVNALDAAYEAMYRENGKDESEESLTLYVLRKNFATLATSWMRLTQMEVKYCMGHAMVEGKKISELGITTRNVCT